MTLQHIGPLGLKSAQPWWAEAAVKHFLTALAAEVIGLNCPRFRMARL